MTPQLVASLSALLWEYYDAGEFLETIRLFIPDFKMPISFDRSKQEYLAVAKLLVDTADLGTTRVLLETLVAQLAIRNTTAIAKTSWQSRAAHETLTPHISGWEAALAAAGLPSEIVVSVRNPFTAKAELREFLEQATTPVLVVDTYVGPATLDCLRLTTQPIRLLTGTGAASIGSGFDAPLADFLTEGHAIEVRRAPMLHDRLIAFNDRCWLVGSSLKDAGSKDFHLTELVDSKKAVVDAVEDKWQAATPYS